jgi:hypothetical protein
MNAAAVQMNARKLTLAVWVPTGTRYTATIGMPAIAGRRATTAARSTARYTAPMPIPARNSSPSSSSMGTPLSRMVTPASASNRLKCVIVSRLGMMPSRAWPSLKSQVRLST